MEKKSAADSGIDYLYDTWTGYISLGVVETVINVNAKFIPDTIKINLAAVGEPNGAADIAYNPFRVTVNGVAGSFVPASGLQLINLTSVDLLDGVANIVQCNMTNTFNPTRIYSNMSRKSFNQSYRVRAHVLNAPNDLVVDGGCLLSIEFIRKRMPEDR